TRRGGSRRRTSAMKCRSRVQRTSLHRGLLVIFSPETGNPTETPPLRPHWPSTGRPSLDLNAVPPVDRSGGTVDAPLSQRTSYGHARSSEFRRLNPPNRTLTQLLQVSRNGVKSGSWISLSETSTPARPPGTVGCWAVDP